MSCVVWRLEPLATPAWGVACHRCQFPFLESTERFRVNANGALHDVWLVYRCARCSTRRNFRVERRVRDSPRLRAYRDPSPRLLAEHAHSVTPMLAVEARVLRPPLPNVTSLEVAIQQPLLCGQRWDQLLSAELGRSRSQVVAAFKRGNFEGAKRGFWKRVVQDGDRVRLRL